MCIIEEGHYYITIFKFLPLQSWLFVPDHWSNQLSWFELAPNQRSNQIFELDFNILPNQSFYQISWFKLAPNQRLSQILGFTFLPNQSLNQIVEEIIKYST